MRRKVDRDTIIEKGLEVMMLKGYEGTGIKEIAESTGMLKGSFYNYFSSKEEFAKVLLEIYAGRVYDFTEMVLKDKSISPVSRVRKLFTGYWQNIFEKHGYEGGCFLGNCSQEIGNTIPFLGKVVNKAFNDTSGLLAVCLQEAQESGEISSSSDAGQLSDYILNSWQGALVRTKSARSNTAFNAFMDMTFNKILK